jgi:hypothetical protein
MPKTYNLKTQVKGDTYPGVTITLTKNGSPIDLTGALIAIEFRESSRTGTVSKTLGIGTGITITDAINGVFTIDPFQVNINAGRHYYDCQVTIAGVVKTYFEGILPVNQDVTNG